MVHITRILLFVATYNTCIGLSVVRDIVVYNNVTNKVENKLFDRRLNSHVYISGQKNLKLVSSIYTITFAVATKIHMIMIYYYVQATINNIINSAYVSLFYGLSQTGSRCLHTRRNRLNINIDQTNTIATMKVSQNGKEFRKGKKKRSIYMGLALSMSLQFEHIVPIIFKELNVSTFFITKVKYGSLYWTFEILVICAASR